MGVPAFFRWLSKKYPSIVVECDESVSGSYDFDNLYLDMNGIIHPCSHPEYKAAPQNESEMFVAIFEYIERIMSIVRPKKMLYMAVDGVAPRAKMNQQRSRRFRASQESVDKLQQINEIKQELRDKGIEVEDKPKEAHFDSNVITPGTQFMINLSEALRQWIDEKLSADDNHLWPKDMMVILSDASVPGEGEHKIVDYIRKQKAMNDTYDPNLSHCLYGADADLIMLGLATHELNFTILREEFIPNQPKPCDICGQLGHEMKECVGNARVEDDDQLVPVEPGFIYIRLNVLREYLQRECSNSPVYLDLERFIDDFVFLCFFVGNDFLPHLPSLEIRENAIDRLLSIYKEVMALNKDSNFYLTQNGLVNLNRVQLILKKLGEVEDEIFKSRQQNELRFKERRKKQKLMQANIDSVWMRPEAINSGRRPQQMEDTRSEAYKLRMYAANVDNVSAAQKLKAMLKTGDVSQVNEKTSSINSSNKRKLEDKDSDDEPEDNVQLWNEGWKERYYLHKFDCSGDSDISRSVAREYIIGLCWVLLYYYQGCPDWKWFYPYHYAPFASDFVDISSIKVEFDRNAKPFNPLEQLMSVFPAASSSNLPPSWRQLMTDTDSSIIDFYPNTFKIDLNGKRAAWMGVALLPFIDEQRLFNALTHVYPNLNEDEKKRNARGTHLIFVSRCASDFSQFSKEVVDSNNITDVQINPSLFRGISGLLRKSEVYSLAYKRVYCSIFKDPEFEKNHIFAAIRLANAKNPPSVLKPQDFEKLDRYSWRPTIGMNTPRSHAYVNDCGMRLLSHSIPRQRFNNDRNAYHGNQQYAHNQHNQQQQQYQPYYRPPQSYQSRNQDNYQNSNYRNSNSYNWQQQQQQQQQNPRSYDGSGNNQTRNYNSPNYNRVNSGSSASSAAPHNYNNPQHGNASQSNFGRPPRNVAPNYNPYGNTSRAADPWNNNNNTYGRKF